MAIILLAFVRMQLLVDKLSFCDGFLLLASHFHPHPLRKLLVPWKLVELLGSPFLEASLGGVLPNFGCRTASFPFPNSVGSPNCTENA